MNTNKKETANTKAKAVNSDRELPVRCKGKKNKFTPEQEREIVEIIVNNGRLLIKGTHVINGYEIRQLG